MLAADDPRHGTANGYSNHGCRCDSCRAAWRDHHREYLWNRTVDCVVEGCDRPLYAKKMCHVHYERVRRGADLLKPVRDKLGSRGRVPGRDWPEERRLAAKRVAA